jgi:hypothetical protein
MRVVEKGRVGMGENTAVTWRMVGGGRSRGAGQQGALEARSILCPHDGKWNGSPHDCGLDKLERRREKAGGRAQETDSEGQRGRKGRIEASRRVEQNKATARGGEGWKKLEQEGQAQK